MPTWAILVVGLLAVLLIGVPGRVGARRVRLAKKRNDETYARERRRYAVMVLSGATVWLVLALSLRQAYLG